MMSSSCCPSDTAAYAAQADLKFAGAPKSALRLLGRLQLEAEHYSPTFFNKPNNYLEITKRALEAQEDTFKRLATCDAWTEAVDSSLCGNIADRQMGVADLGARMGQDEAAMELVKLSAASVNEDDDDKRVASLLLKRGLEVRTCP